jgi:S-layer protein
MVSSKTTADTTVDAGGVVKLATAKTATVSAGDSVQVSGVTGAVSITTAVPATDLAAVTATGWTAAPGVFVRNGTTVSVTETAGTSTAGAAATGNATKIQIGSTPTSSTLTAGTASGAKLNSTASQYPEVVGNLSSAPTGDVTISVKTPYTDTKGYKNVTYGTGTVDIYMNGGTTASVTGAAGVTVTDLQTIKLLPSASGTAAPGTSTLTTVNLTGVSSSVGIHSDAISNLSILDTAGQTVTINSNTGKNNVALNVSVGNSTPTISASQASSVAFTGITAAYEKIGDNLVTANSGSTVVLQAAKATALSFAGSSDITLGTTSAAAAVTSITSTSGKKVTLGDVATSGYLTKLSSIDASGASGALSVTIGAPGAAGGVGYGMNVKGGSGNDSVTLKTGTSTASVVNVDGVTVSTAVSLGAGNDKLLNGGVVGGSSGNSNATATLSNTSTIDGGEGTDTISVSLLNAGNAATAKNFEILDVKGSTSGTTSFDASLLTNSTVTGVAVSGNIGGTTTVSNIAGTDLTVSVTDTGDAAGSVTAYLATSTGTADTATVTYAGVSTTGSTVTAQTSQITTFKTTGIESVAIASGATLTNVGDTMSNILDTFQDTSNKTATITITGANKFTLGAYVSATSYTDGVEQYTTAPTTAITDATTAAALKTIDASGATGAVTIVAGLTQVDIHNDADANADSASITNLIFTGLTITGGSGADKLVNLAAAGIVNGGAGADAITVTGAAAVVDGGDGADTITVNAAVSTTLTGGAGNNTYVLTAAKAGADATTAPKMTTITDYKTSDTLSIGDSTPWAKADVSAAGSLQAALVLCAKDGDAGNASWFTWGNFTYIVKDSGSGGTADDDLGEDDVIVKLTGVFDLSVLSGDATTGLIGLA